MDTFVTTFSVSVNFQNFLWIFELLIFNSNIERGGRYFKYRPLHEYFSFLVLPLYNLFGFEISWRDAPLNSLSLFIFVEFLVNFWIADLKANVEVEPGVGLLLGS